MVVSTDFTVSTLGAVEAAPGVDSLLSGVSLLSSAIFEFSHAR